MPTYPGSAMSSSAMAGSGVLAKVEKHKPEDVVKVRRIARSRAVDDIEYDRFCRMLAIHEDDLDAA